MCGVSVTILAFPKTPPPDSANSHTILRLPTTSFLATLLFYEVLLQRKFSKPQIAIASSRLSLSGTCESSQR
jgi:hypothetical protein